MKPISFAAVALLATGCAPGNVPTFSRQERVFLLTSDDVVHVVRGDGKEVATYAAPDGTRSIAHDGAHLLALSAAGVDAIDDVTGRHVQHISDRVGNHVAFASGHVAVADDRSVHFADAGTFPLDADVAIDEFVSYDGWFGFFNVPSGDPTTSIFHRFVNEADVSSGSGDGKDLGARFPDPSTGFGDTNLARVVVDGDFPTPHQTLLVSDLQMDLLGERASWASWGAFDIDASLDVKALAIDAGQKEWPYGKQR